MKNIKKGRKNNGLDFRVSNSITNSVFRNDDSSLYGIKINCIYEMGWDRLVSWYDRRGD